MKHIKRKAALLTDSASSLHCQELTSALPNWEIVATSDWQDNFFLPSGTSLGFFLLTDAASQNTNILQRLDQTLARLDNTPWIAIITEEQLRNPSIRSLVAERSQDYFTLPLQQITQKIKAVIGHLIGITEFRRIYFDAVLNNCETQLLGSSTVFQEVIDTLPRIARSDAPVLITGESGTGKELVAQWIHKFSAAKNGPFIAVNCGAIPRDLLESELFGHVKGAFTGADRDNPGKIKTAHNGTLFLDEIGDLPKEHQVKLLRFLEDGIIDPVGAQRPEQVTTRIVAATNVDIGGAVRKGEFREDLMYRLNVLNVHIPPLRDRGDDVIMLANHFLKYYQQKDKTDAKKFSDSALLALSAHAWPGNVRELMNRIRKASLLAKGPTLSPADLQLAEPQNIPSSVINLESVRASAEKHALLLALDSSEFNISRAARRLGVSRMTLYRLLDKHSISL